MIDWLQKQTRQLESSIESSFASRISIETGWAERIDTFSAYQKTIGLCSFLDCGTRSYW